MKLEAAAPVQKLETRLGEMDATLSQLAGQQQSHAEEQKQRERDEKSAAQLKALEDVTPEGSPRAPGHTAGRAT